MNNDQIIGLCILLSIILGLMCTCICYKCYKLYYQEPCLPRGEYKIDIRQVKRALDPSRLQSIAVQSHPV